MTDKVRADLVLRAMQLLVPLSDGNYPAAELALIDAQVEPLVADLNKRGITYVGDTDSYAPEQFLDLALLLAHVSAHDMGLAAMPLDERKEAEANLRLKNAGEPSGAVLQAEYF